MNAIEEVTSPEEAEFTRVMKWKMPEIGMGEPVVYYRNGIKDANAPTIAFVVRMPRNGRSVNVRLASGAYMDNVPHVSDPRIQPGNVYTENGAWDYTDQWKDVQELKNQVTELQKQVAMIYSHIAKQSVQPSPVRAAMEKSSAPIQAYRELRQKAMDAGIEFKGNPKKEWLLEQIAKASS